MNSNENIFLPFLSVSLGVKGALVLMTDGKRTEIAKETDGKELDQRWILVDGIEKVFLDSLQHWNRKVCIYFILRFTQVLWQRFLAYWNSNWDV